MAEFEVQGQRYRCTKLNAKEQLKVMKRLLPMITAFSGVNIEAAMRGDPAEAALIGANLTESLHRLTDEDMDYVLDTCMSKCSRAVPGGLGWSPAWSREAELPMFDDISGPTMMVIIGRVLVDSIGDFSSALSQLSRAGPALAPLS